MSTEYDEMPQWPKGTPVAYKNDPSKKIGIVADPFTWTEAVMVVRMENGELERIRPSECVVWKAPKPETTDAQKQAAQEYAGNDGTGNA